LQKFPPAGSKATSFWKAQLLLPFGAISSDPTSYNEPKFSLSPQSSYLNDYESISPKLPPLPRLAGCLLGWRQKIKAGIEAAPAIVLVLSFDTIASREGLKAIGDQLFS
jgi:hypothetical protein